MTVYARQKLSSYAAYSMLLKQINQVALNAWTFFTSNQFIECVLW